MRRSTEKRFSEGQSCSMRVSRSTGSGLPAVRGEYALPRAVIKFRQGFGRLIRSHEDYGAVAVLDPRVSTKRYGGAFLRSIPACRRVASLEELEAFFRDRAGE